MIKIKIDIIAFADKTGSYEINKKLAEGRIKSVKQALITMGLDGSRINEFPFDQKLIENDPRLVKFKNERGILIFAKLGKL